MKKRLLKLLAALMVVGMLCPFALAEYDGSMWVDYDWIGLDVSEKFTLTLHMDDELYEGCLNDEYDLWCDNGNEKGIYSQKWGDWTSDGSKLTLTGKKPGDDTIRFWVEDEDGETIAETSMDITVRIKGTKLTSAKSPKKGQIKVSWKKVKGVSGYDIEVSDKNDFESGRQKTYRVSSKNSSLTIKSGKHKLKSGKKYYIRIGTYKKKGSKVLESFWSSVKVVKVK